jgi:hypothetical protein
MVPRRLMVYEPLARAASACGPAPPPPLLLRALSRDASASKGLPLLPLLPSQDAPPSRGASGVASARMVNSSVSSRSSAIVSRPACSGSWRGTRSTAAGATAGAAACCWPLLPLVLAGGCGHCAGGLRRRRLLRQEGAAGSAPASAACSSCGLLLPALLLAAAACWLRMLLRCASSALAVCATRAHTAAISSASADNCSCSRLARRCHAAPMPAVAALLAPRDTAAAEPPSCMDSAAAAAATSGEACMALDHAQRSPVQRNERRQPTAAL